MKKLFILLLLVSGLQVAANAQGYGNHRGGGNYHPDMHSNYNRGGFGYHDAGYRPHFESHVIVRPHIIAPVIRPRVYVAPARIYAPAPRIIVHAPVVYGGYAYGYNNYGYNNYSYSSFDALMNTLRNDAYDSDRLAVAKSGVQSGTYSAAQIRDIMSTFSYEASRLEFAEFAYPYAVDKGNYGIVTDAFQYPSSATELSNYITNSGY